MKYLKKLGSAAQKKMTFFPNTFSKDEFLAEFMVSKKGNPLITDCKLDPDNLGFPQPDFGFDYDFDFDENSLTDNARGWKRFMDTMSVFPKYERIKNYIDFVNQKKINKL